MMRAGIRFTRGEIKELAISTIALGFIFSVSHLSILYFLVLTSILALSFVPHELAHKFVAIRYGHHARYVMWKEGLIFALLLAIITGGNFIFAAPGAVMISRMSIYSNSRENAIISAAGPASNIIMAAIAYTLYQFYPIFIFSALTQINAFLAFFNLLPIPPLDGSKVIWYSIPLWAVMIVTAGILVWSV
jgi:Zn-dependent protease